MDETDPKEDFYRAIADSRERERSEAVARISAREDEGYRIIADAARRIAEVVHGGARPDTISQVIESFGDLPLTTEWYGFIEIAGQVVLGKGISENDPGLLNAGLGLMEKARSLGLPLSSLSQAMVSKASGEKSVSARARKILEE